MTTFLTPALSPEEAPIPFRTLVFFRRRLRYILHEIVFREFQQQESAGKLTRASLARRLGKRPEQITRWLGAPGNWTLDTISDLLSGMDAELTCGVSRRPSADTVRVQQQENVADAFTTPTECQQLSHAVRVRIARASALGKSSGSARAAEVPFIDQTEPSPASTPLDEFHQLASALPSFGSASDSIQGRETQVLQTQLSVPAS